VAHLDQVHRIVFETLGSERAAATAEALQEIAQAAGNDG
jgi:hypothetical protein